PAYYAPPPAPPKKSRLGIFVLIGIVAVGVVLFILFRDRLPNDVSSLAVGECFDEPSVTSSITEVQRQPCNEPHDDEVFFLVTDPASGAYPGVEHFRELARTQCLPAASAYLAADFDARPDIDAGYLYPTSESWDGGDRGVTCYLYRVDEAKLSISLRNIGTSPLP
ncbi:MAG: septum formation family protein, partial [Chloroflexota bacterium]